MLLDAAFTRLPADIFIANPDALLQEDTQEFATPIQVGRAADGATIKEGSYHVGQGGRLSQVIGGESVVVPVKNGKTGDGISLKAAKIIRGLMPIRDAVRDVLRAQAAGQPWKALQVRLRTCYSNFIRYYGPINHTVVSTLTDDETGEEREQHRRPNLAHFADDPDCWLVASIEDYDLDTGVARMGPIFRERVVAPPALPMITSAADALAVTLNEQGFVDPERLGELLECEPHEALKQLGSAVFRDPMTEQWETADAYLSGPVRHKLVAAEAAARLDGKYQRNVAALQEVQPRDIPPSDITARLGAPWLPTEVIQDFVREVMGGAGQGSAGDGRGNASGGGEVEIFHTVEVAAWGVKASGFAGTAQGTSEWGTARRHAGQLLHDALNSATPQIYDIEVVDGSERRVFNPEATEAAKEKLVRIKTAFTQWVTAWVEGLRAPAPVSATAPEIVAIDGKTSRHTHDHGKDRGPLHMVSAWASSQRLVLGQQACEAKSNEITAIPLLLERLALTGALVTIDAMGTQTKIAQAVLDRGGDYLLALKANQSSLHDEIRRYLDDPAAKIHSRFETTDGDHGRIEVRRHLVSHDVDWLTTPRRFPGEPRFPGLRAIAVVKAKVERNGSTSLERRYFLSSMPLDAKIFAYAVRCHWHVENRLHWVLDVVFHEDLSRLRSGAGPRNMATVRHMAMNLLQGPKDKHSLKVRRKSAAWDTAYLEALLRQSPCARFKRFPCGGNQKVASRSGYT